MDELILEKSKVYRGRMVVTSPFEVLEKHVVPPLEEVGFTDVKVWWWEDELPADWPPDKRADMTELGETMVYLEGTWNGKDGQVAPSSGDHWTAYDMWPKGGEGVVYGKRKTTLGKAMLVGGWTLGIFLAGLPIVLAMSASREDK